jgi:hypothetical protein
MNVLQWLREIYCPWDAATYHAAARGGHLEALKWARERHCSWNHVTSFSAPAGKHLEHAPLRAGMRRC